jgi:site-specific DNA-cytosine methylase
MDLGFAAAGFRGVYACDIDAAAVETYRRNLGEHAEVADLTRLEPEHIPDADVWIAGPPCQPYSIAGKRRGSFDPRDMWPHVLRLLAARRPEFAVFENVPGLLSWNGGVYFHDITERLRAMGYSVTCALLDAADYGVAQHRRRIFLLCRLGGPPPAVPWPTHTDPRLVRERNLLDPNPRRPWVTVRQALGIEVDSPSSVVTAREGHGLGNLGRQAGAGRHIARIIAGRTVSIPGHGAGAAPDDASVAILTVPPVWALTDEPAPTLAASSGRGGPHPDGGAASRREWRRLGFDPSSLVDAPSGTLRAGTHGQGGFSPRHRAGYVPAGPRGVSVARADAPSPTVRAGGGKDHRGKLYGGHPPYVEEEIPPATRVAPTQPLDPDSPTDTSEPRSPHSDAPRNGEPGWKIQAGVADQALVPAGDSPILDAPSSTLRAATHGLDNTRHQRPSGFIPDFPAQTIDSSGELHRPGRHEGGEPSRGPNSATFLRRLTVAECSRLQAFPDWFSFVGSKTTRYAQIGNAVPPLLAWHIANAVREAIGPTADAGSGCAELVHRPAAGMGRAGQGGCGGDSWRAIGGAVLVCRAAPAVRMICATGRAAPKRTCGTSASLKSDWWCCW